MKTKNTELLKEIEKQKFITENQILLLKHRIQKQFYENKTEEILEFKNFMMKKFDYEISLSFEQKLKGINYIKKKYFTYHGYLRNNKSIKLMKENLNNLNDWYNSSDIEKEYDFTFCGFVLISNGIMTFIEPIYKIDLYFYHYKKSFRYFHFNGIDYDYNHGYLKDNNILFIKGRI